MNSPVQNPLVVERNGFRFEWCWQFDQAKLVRQEGELPVWSGSLMPAIEVMEGKGARIYPATGIRSLNESQNRLELVFDYGAVAFGKALIGTTDFGLSIERFELKWKEDPLPIVSIYYGASELTAAQQQACPIFGATVWPDWKAEGFCVPGAKSNPGQSFWRAWDMGNAVLPLGSFGPAMGAPYVAAFPRPTLAAAMGGGAGWFVFGPGSIPDGALSLEIKSSSAWMHLLMREDLWGAPSAKTRSWDEPLRLTWHADSWDGFASLFQTFPILPPAHPSSQHSHWGTWGSFMKGRFDLNAEFASAEYIGARDLQIDDGWETWKSSGKCNFDRFPEFTSQLDLFRQKGMKIGLWLSVGWVSKPEEVGLSNEDLLCGPDGLPRLGSWSLDPRSSQAGLFCLDPSSDRTRAFLVDRTCAMVRDYQPDLLKLDFGYGLPGPDGAAPRNPLFRGERLAYELIKIISEAARFEKQSVALEFYGIHPLFRCLYDVVSLDDLGDMGVHEADGHHQRSVYAALAAAQGAAIMASSGYYWSAVEEILLNAAVLGAPGVCCPEIDANGERMSRKLAARIRALNTWHRHTTGWKPLWLNSHRGDLTAEPKLRCWGRMEQGDRLASIALRDGDKRPDLSSWGILDWEGRWAIISLTDDSIGSAQRVACIPFDAGNIRWSDRGFIVSKVQFENGVETQSVARADSGELRIDCPEILDRLMGFLIERDSGS